MKPSNRIAYSRKRYRAGVFALMAVYLALMLLAWPAVRGGHGLATRVVLAVLPALPVIGVIWLMVWRVLHADELEQRLHMIALSVASGVVAAASLVGGFLGAAGVLVRGDLLIWVFPALCVVYGLARWLAARRYGVAGCE